MRRPFLFWGFKSSHEILENSLGALEREVMAVVLGSRRTSTSATRCARLSSPVAYTTVMTTMDRLFKKGLLSRRKVGRAFVYRADRDARRTGGRRRHRARSEPAAIATGSEPLPILSSLVDAVSDATARCSTNWSG